MADAIDRRGRRAASAKTPRTRRQIIPSKGVEVESAVVLRGPDGPLTPASLFDRAFYARVYTASPEDRIIMIRRGVPASDTKKIVKDLGVEQNVLHRALGFKTATVNRKVTRNDPLSSDESERLLGLAKLVGQLETIVSESGEPAAFDAARWLSRWLREPLPALGGQMPMSFLDTMEGQALVSDALARIQSGAYA